MRKVLFAGGLAMGLALAGPAFSDCNDVQKTCHDTYIRSIGDCQRNTSGSDREACIKRAEQQLEYCFKAGGCPN